MSAVESAYRTVVRNNAGLQANYTMSLKMSLLCLTITLTMWIDFDNFGRKCYWESRQSKGTSFSHLT